MQNHTTAHPIWKTAATLLATVLATLLAACGGGGQELQPQVTGFQVNRLQYGRAAIFLVGGTDLRSSMVAETGAGCTSPSFSSSNSTTTLAVLTCTVTAVGDLPVTIKSAEGAVLYKTTVTVPQPQVTLATSMGNITVELNPQAAPITVKNFLDYVNKGFYASTLFHRVIAGFMVQGGGYTTGLVGKTGLSSPITLETNKGLSNLRGTIAMARTSVADSATSQFYINLVNNTFLDYQSASSPGYAVFGQVTDGMAVVDAIGAVSTANLNGVPDVPVTDVTITSATQIK